MQKIVDQNIFTKNQMHIDGLDLKVSEISKSIIEHELQMKVIETDIRAQVYEMLNDFIKSNDVQIQQAKEEIHQTQVLTQEITERLKQLERSFHEISVRIIDSEQNILAVYRSTSWRITEPIRWLRRVLSYILHLPRVLKNKIKNTFKQCVPHLISYIRQYTWLEKLAYRVVNRLPYIKMRLQILAVPAVASIPSIRSIPVSSCQELDDLTPRAKEIYFLLKSAAEQENKKNNENYF